MQNHRAIPLIIAITAMCAPFIAFATNVHAGNRNWLGNSGKWAQQTNWNPAFVPMVGDHAVFSTPTGYTVDLTQSVIVDVLDFTSGAGTFTSIGGGPWSLRMIAGTGLNLDAGLIIGQNIIFTCDQTASIEAEFKLLGNATLNCDNLNIGTTTTSGIFEAAPGIVDVDIAAQIGNFDGSYGRFYLDGGATQYTSAFTHLINGEMTVSGGAKANMTIFDLLLGNTSPTISSATFTGAGTIGTVTGMDMSVGTATGLGSADLRIANDATFNANGIEVWPNGTLQHDGGTLNAGPGITVTGGTWTRALNTMLTFNTNTFDVFLDEEAMMSWGGLNQFGGTSSSNYAEFNVRGGSTAEVHGIWGIGFLPGTYGRTIVLSDFGPSTQRSTLRSTGGLEFSDLIVGNGGNGELYVWDGSLCEFQDDLIFGLQAGSYGSALVSGVWQNMRATIDVSNGSGAEFVIGQSGSGSCTVNDGGLIDVGGDVSVARSPGTNCSLFIQGINGIYRSQVTAGGSLILGGSNSAEGGTAIMFVEDGGEMLCSSGTKVWRTGDLYILDEGKLVTGDLEVRGKVIVNRGGRIDASKCEIRDMGAGDTFTVGTEQDTEGTIFPTIISLLNSIYIGGTSTTASGLGNVTIGPYANVRTRGGYIWPNGTLWFTRDTSNFIGSLSLTTANGFTNAGKIYGDGTIGKTTFSAITFNNNGGLYPGAPLGLGELRITDINVNFNASGSLNVDLAGTGAGEYDTMRFAGNSNVNLGGPLYVNFINGFTPQLNDEFTIIPISALSSGNLFGNFALIVGPIGYEFEVQVFAEHAVLKVIDVPCPANIAGNDDLIDVTDLFALLANWNTGGAGADLAPPTNIVDVSDLFVLLGAWGACP